MKADNITMPFDDAPEIEQVESVITGWHRPDLPNGLKNLVSTSATGDGNVVWESLTEIQSSRYKRQLEVKAIGWLYDFIRANVKRGRVFDLGEVLRQGSADCLGYAKLFTLLGRLFGLDVGVIEVIVDNGGRHVPHTAVLVRLGNRRRHFVDLWYGSKNIKHKRIGLQVKRGRAWKIEDLELKELDNLEEVRYLPDLCVDAITLYIRGNRHLDRQDFDSAIKCFSQAIGLYPGNARFFYNRAIAYENLGEHQKANADYRQALHDDTALIRILAREHDEVISLLDLDAKGIGNLAQEIYLLRKGFTTGKGAPLGGVARRFGLPETETVAILSLVEAKLATGSDSNRKGIKQ